VNECEVIGDYIVCSCGHKYLAKDHCEYSNYAQDGCYERCTCPACNNACCKNRNPTEDLEPDNDFRM
jgi:hypothetical protein